MTLEETSRHDPNHEYTQVEERHEHPDALEEVSNEQDTHCPLICRLHSLEHVEGDDTDEHHREDQESIRANST